MDADSCMKSGILKPDSALMFILLSHPYTPVVQTLKCYTLLIILADPFAYCPTSGFVELFGVGILSIGCVTDNNTVRQGCNLSYTLSWLNPLVSVHYHR